MQLILFFKFVFIYFGPHTLHVESYFPSQVSNLCPLRRVLPTEPPGKSLRLPSWPHTSMIKADSILVYPSPHSEHTLPATEVLRSPCQPSLARGPATWSREPGPLHRPGLSCRFLNAPYVQGHGAWVFPPENAYKPMYSWAPYKNASLLNLELGDLSWVSVESEHVTNDKSRV